ncbi:hypothetical protein T4A_5470 [Trichinella pseudospiralis]|uniref:Uncharacterized protein n=1 Tax=Trichinella pseudospiralis TaxID=6337 RepID=A0A0V1F182_TRIPS|nr:hypothetical protein T4E_11142 [Trichinella pseudospiralis]KRY79650.1 hypothetical protein T4A_5470 [Trichinella pseudospiralis]KRY86558.1 hypothetical protein T4D_5924 [Trichinella pseudospiralis]KRZ41183.1 hypothetical protein T4C_6743 [Trichinella pseudospiralis]
MKTRLKKNEDSVLKIMSKRFKSDCGEVGANPSATTEDKELVKNTICYMDE